MGLLSWMGIGAGRADALPAPHNAVQEAGGGVTITTPDQLESAIRAALVSGSGAVVTPETAMRVAAVFACVRLRANAVANLPFGAFRRIDDKTREPLAPEHWLTKLLRRRPNRWQTPSQFKKMMEAHIQLRGNAYALKVVSRGMVLELVPLHPDRVKCKQLDDWTLVYEYTRKDGRTTILKQEEMFHLVGLTLDGVHGVSVIHYARETIGLSLSMENHGATVFKNGARPSNVLSHPNKLGKEGIENLRASLDAYRAGGENDGQALILEEGMTVAPIAMTAEDAQWIESRKFSRSDIAMFFGVPPHMIGDTEKSTSWGTGIEQQGIGFVTYSLEDSLTAWEETANRDLVPDNEPEVFTRINRKALVRGDLKTRQGFYTAMMQWGVYSPNEVRALEDENPREGGDIYYDPPNTAGGQNQQDPQKEGNGNEPSQPA